MFFICRGTAMMMITVSYPAGLVDVCWTDFTEMCIWSVVNCEILSWRRKVTQKLHLITHNYLLSLMLSELKTQWWKQSVSLLQARPDGACWPPLIHITKQLYASCSGQYIALLSVAGVLTLKCRVEFCFAKSDCYKANCSEWTQKTTVFWHEM